MTADEPPSDSELNPLVGRGPTSTPSWMGAGPPINSDDVAVLAEIIERYCGPLVGVHLAAIEIAGSFSRSCSHPWAINNVCGVCGGNPNVG